MRDFTQQKIENSFSVNLFSVQRYISDRMVGSSQLKHSVTALFTTSISSTNNAQDCMSELSSPQLQYAVNIAKLSITVH